MLTSAGMLKRLSLTVLTVAIAVWGGPPSSVSAGEREVTLAGLQIWNAEYWQTTSLGDYMGSNYHIKKLKPISLVGFRNGFFSGYIVATSATAPINALKAKITDLVEKGGKKIPAAQVLIRYPELARVDTSWSPPYRFDRILDEPPEEVKMVDMRSWRDWQPKKTGPIAMQPIWVTVRVPTNAAPGDYEGVLTVEAENEKPYTVQVKMTVHDWLLSDPRQYAVHNMVWLCPERLAIYYDVPLWGEKHLEYCAKSLQMALLLGSRNVEANLVLRYPSRDNRETMVKWIKQPDGKFKYDFTAFDKYMDTVAKAIGKPYVLRLCMWSPACWENPDDEAKGKKPTPHPVVVVDPATGKTEEFEPPPLRLGVTRPETVAFWKPVFDEVRARTDKRGWSDVVAPNWHQYCGGPDTNTVSMVQQLWPGMKWADNDHGRRTGFAGLKKEDWTPVIVQSTVWNEPAMRLRGYKGWKPAPPAYCGHARGRTREWSLLWELRVFIEETILKGEHGVDPMGGDLWMIQDERGRWVGGAWAAAALGPGNCTRALFAPGPDGPIATERYEAMREGVQICEATLFIQRGIEAGKLDAALAERANKILDARGKLRIDSWVLRDKSGAMRFDEPNASAGALESENELYAVAAEVAKALGKQGIRP